MSGAILSDRVKILDWRAREAKLIETVTKETIEAVVARITPLLTESGD